jgi:hypothetical protein
MLSSGSPALLRSVRYAMMRRAAAHPRVSSNVRLLGERLFLRETGGKRSI